MASRTSRIASAVHKWLALLMAIQILFWFASGLFFALAPIERVRGEHRIAEQPAAAIAPGEAAAGLARIAAEAPGDRIEIRSLLGRPVAVVSAREQRPRLYDLESGARLSPLPAELAARIAEADLAGPARAARVEAVRDASAEYRGPLPAWRVGFEGEGALALYVAADTGAVTARRSTLWRWFDFLWGLHIMDWKERDDINTPLLVVASALGLIVVASGILLLPSRLGWTGRRRRRARLSRS